MVKHVEEHESNTFRDEGMDLDFSVYPWSGMFRVLVLSYRYDFNHLATFTLEVIKRESKVTPETQNE